MLQQNGVSMMMVSRSSRSYYHFIPLLNILNTQYTLLSMPLGSENVAKAQIFLYFWGAAAMTSFPFFFSLVCISLITVEFKSQMH
jgi:hypothetical protein